MLLAAFGPTSDETALFYLVGVVCFAIAALVVLSNAVAATREGTDRRPRRVLTAPLLGWQFLVALGLLLWLWPTMWSAIDAAW
jgi:hypothetical protein